MRSKPPKKATVLTLVERGGESHSFHIANVKVQDAARCQCARSGPQVAYRHGRIIILRSSWSRVFWTFDGPIIREMNTLRLGGFAHVNTAEARFSLTKRAVFGTHHSVSEAHLSRYLAEWDFKWNTRKTIDGERAAIALKGIEGKRLTYRRTNEAARKKRNTCYDGEKTNDCRSQAATRSPQWDIRAAAPRCTFERDISHHGSPQKNES